VIILAVSLLLGQFRFFWNYEKKILLWMGILKNSKPQSSSKSSHVTQAMQVIKD
jgi:hypothetical protein